MTATVVLPKLKCGPEPHAIRPGVGGYYGSTLHPHHFSDAGVFVGCNEGKILYFPAFTLNGTARNFHNLKLHAGDTVVLKASVQATGTTLSLVDKTTKGVNKTLTGKGHSSTIGPWAADSAWVNFSEGGVDPVPNFGKLTFSHALLNGQPFGNASGLVQYNRQRHSTLEISTGPFESNQETFTTVYHHA
jgi:hypothetical protein